MGHPVAGRFFIWCAYCTSEDSDKLCQDPAASIKRHPGSASCGCDKQNSTLRSGQRPEIGGRGGRKSGQRGRQNLRYPAFALKRVRRHSAPTAGIETKGAGGGRSRSANQQIETRNDTNAALAPGAYWRVNQQAAHSGTTTRRSSVAVLDKLFSGTVTAGRRVCSLMARWVSRRPARPNSP